MELWTPFIGGLVVFLLRVGSVALGTMRQIIVVRGHRYLGAVFGFFEVLIFLMAISKVVQEGNWSDIIGYCLGFSIGTIVGAIIEEQVALGYSLVHVITREKAGEIATALRDRGFGVTEMVGEGRDGLVFILEVVARRKDVRALRRCVESIYDRAFITIEEAYSVQRGYFVRDGER